MDDQEANGWDEVKDVWLPWRGQCAPQGRKKDLQPWWSPAASGQGKQWCSVQLGALFLVDSIRKTARIIFSFLRKTKISLHIITVPQLPLLLQEQRLHGPSETAALLEGSEETSSKSLHGDRWENTMLTSTCTWRHL